VCRALPEAAKLDHRFLLREFVRDLTPTANGDDASATSAPAGRLDVRETIHRQSTVAALVFHGVRPGEDARWTTMWAVLGQPLVSVAVPCFAAATSVAPVLDASPRSRLCDAAIAIQERVYEVATPSGDAAATRGGAGDDVVAGPPRWLIVDAVAPVQAVTLPVEDAILAATAAALRRWRAAGAAFDPVALTRHHEAAAAAACAAVELALASAPSPVSAEAPAIGR
jgi:hypothetical protein